ncbi:MAG: hypothetical protein FWB83_02725 [Treponema sp.]|nr:hypothetical protein [Treponema sp.]
MKKDDRKILSVDELLHLQSDKHDKKDQSVPDVDTSKFVLKQKPMEKASRNFAPVVKFTDEQRKQFQQGGSGKSRDAVLAEQARQAIKIAELHAKEDAIEQEKAAAEKPPEEVKTLTNEIKSGSFDFGFGALIEGAEDLKETI